MVVERWGRVSGLALVPGVAVLAVDPAGASPFGPLRAVAVPAVVLGGLALACRGRPRLARRPLVAWAVLLVVVAASAVGGLDPRAAWMGTSERHLGALTWGLFAVAFAAGQVLDADRARRAVAGGAVAALGVLGAWAAAEALGWRPVPLTAAPDRLVGPLGSAAFLGAAAVLLLPVAAGVVLDRSWCRRDRIVAAVAGGLGVVALVGSGARAAWLGAVAVAGVAAWRARPAWRRWTVRAGAVGRGSHAVASSAVALLVGVAAVGGIAAATGNLDRVPGAWRDEQGGARGRVDEWRIAARTVARHPLLGVGPEGGRIAFGAAVDDDYERTHGRSPLPDRAHSGPLDMAVASGLAGLLSLLVLWVAVGRHLVRAVRRAPPWLAGVALGVTAYGLQQLALFPLAELDPLAWLLAGLVVGATTGPGEAVTLPHPRAVAIGAAAASSLAVVAGAPTVLADRQARASLAAQDRGDIAGARRAAAQAVALAPHAVRLRLLAADVAAADGTSAGIDGGLAQVTAALRTSPRDPQARLRHAQLLLQRATRTGSADAAVEARHALETLATDDPRNAEVLVALGVARARDGDPAAARLAWLRAEDLAPRSAAASVDLALAAAAEGRWDEARAAAGRAVTRDPGSADVLTAVLRGPAPPP